MDFDVVIASPDAMRVVGHRAVDRGGYTGVVHYAAAPAPVPVQLTGPVDQGDRLLPPAHQIG